jgi:hypothetical protein
MAAPKFYLTQSRWPSVVDVHYKEFSDKEEEREDIEAYLSGKKPFATINPGLGEEYFVRVGKKVKDGDPVDESITDPILRAAHGLACRKVRESGLEAPIDVVDLRKSGERD